jgi:hypothetical protein
MDPFKQMRDTGAHARRASAAAAIVAKAAKARQARWERENRMTQREAAPASADLAASDTFSDWVTFALFVAMFLAFVVGAVAVLHI